MATASLSVLKQRADTAEMIISTLRHQVASLHEALSGKTEETLRSKNATLCEEVKRLKTELYLAEIRNGVRQWYVPANISIVASPSNTPNEVKATETRPEPPAEARGDTKKVAETTPKTEKSDKKGKPAVKGDAEKIDVSRLDLRVGRILGVEKHPDADTLYVENVDIGETETRTVVSGLVKHIPQDQMQNRLAMFMCNLKPTKVRGILSEAMIMCATSADHATVEILDLPDGAAIGDRVTVDEYPGTADVQLNPKKKIWEQIKPDLLTNGECVATYKGSPCVIAGKGHISAKTVAHGQIS